MTDTWSPTPQAAGTRPPGASPCRRPGRPARFPHDYERHGATALYAALNVATGEVLAQCYPRHRHQEFLDFLKLVQRQFLGQSLHLIVDNASTDLHANAAAWLEKHPGCSSTSPG